MEEASPHSPWYIPNINPVLPLWSLLLPGGIWSRWHVLRKVLRKSNLHTRNRFSVLLEGALGMGSTSPHCRDTSTVSVPAAGSGCVHKGFICLYIHEYCRFCNYLSTVFAYPAFRLTMGIQTTSQGEPICASETFAVKNDKSTWPVPGFTDTRLLLWGLDQHQQDQKKTMATWSRTLNKQATSSLWALSDVKHKHHSLIKKKKKGILASEGCHVLTNLENYV